MCCKVSATVSVTERLPLSRERIAAAALATGDDNGLEGLTMRSVGASLGVEAMSLYNHVANKDDLLDSIGDILYLEILDRYKTTPSTPWQQDAHNVVNAFYDVAMEHPNMVAILTERPLASGVKVIFLQRCYEIFVKAGFPLDDAALAFNTVSSWLTGVVRFELSIMLNLAAQDQQLAHEDVPEEFHDAIDFLDSCMSWTAKDRLDAGFKTFIAGIEQQLSTKAG